MVIILKLDKEKYIEHIRDREQILNMRKILDKIEIVLDKHTIQSTDFLDPYERRLAESILNRFLEISYIQMGGIEESERKIILIYPEYYEYYDIEPTIKALLIEGNIGKLSHRDFLGSILNLGINREKVGDILIHEGYVQLIVKKEISEFVLLNLERVGKEKVHIKPILLKDLMPTKVEYKNVSTTIPSLRLDALISACWNLSRSDSQRLIQSDKVKINWEPINKPSNDVVKGDVISAKGYGRCILDSVEGLSKKGRIRVKFRLLK